MESEDGVSGLLNTMEKAILLIGPQLKANDTKMETKKTGIITSMMSLFSAFVDLITIQLKKIQMSNNVSSFPKQK